MIDKERLEAHLANGKREYIMCSAIHVNDGKDYTHKPFNIDKGLVYCGWRHSNIQELFKRKEVDTQKDTQGFLTNKNRFLNRKEAAILAKENGQYSGNNISLYSEDLW